MCACVCGKSLQLYPTLCNPIDGSPPGSSVHGILQARTLEWAAVPAFRGSSEPMSLMSPVLASGFLATSTTWEAHLLECFKPVWKEICHVPSEIPSPSAKFIFCFMPVPQPTLPPPKQCCSFPIWITSLTDLENLLFQGSAIRTYWSWLHILRRVTSFAWFIHIWEMDHFLTDYSVW